MTARRLLLAGLALAVGVGALLLVRAWREPAGPLGVDVSFPAEALRLNAEAPAFALTDQLGKPFSLADRRGEVVLITGIYTTCPKACPVLLSETRGVVQGLADELRADLRVAAITLDPERDTQERLRTLADGLQVGAPPFHFLTGEPAAVDAVLDRYEFTRRRDPETGLIDHAPIALLVDRRGRLAYRLSLAKPGGTWLDQALRHLLAEPG